MYWQTALALFLGVAAALPANPGADDGLEARDNDEGAFWTRDYSESDLDRRDRPQKVRIHKVGFLGSGCPAGTADVTVDATGSLFEATFSQFTTQTGPGIPASEWRKNCKLTINMEFDSGFQFSVLETTTRGFATLPSGVKGTVDTLFYFTGQNQIKFPHSISGPRYRNGDNFEVHANPGILSWSPCGGSTAILNMNTQCAINPTNKQASISVDAVSGKLIVKIAISWRRCH